MSNLEASRCARSDEEQPRKSRKRRTLWGWVWRLASLLVIVVGVLTSVLMWRLSRGPVDLEFLVPRIETALNDAIKPLSVSIGRLTLIWHGWQDPLDLRVVDVRFSKPNGGQLAQFSDLGLAVAPAPLLRGELVLIGIELTDVVGQVIRREDGSFDLPEELLAGDPDSVWPDDVAGWIELWLDPSDPQSIASRLQWIRVRGARLELEDRQLGLTLGTDQFDLDFERDEASLKASLPLRLQIGGETLNLPLVLVYGVAEQELRADLELSDINLSTFASIDERVDFLEAVDLRFDGTVGGVFARGSQLSRADFELRSDRGRISGSLEAPEGLPSSSIVLQFDDLKPWLLADLSAQLEPLEGIRLPLDGTTTLQLDGGKLRQVELECRAAGDEADWGSVSAELRFAEEGSKISGTIALHQLKPAVMARSGGNLGELARLRLAIDADFQLEIVDGRLHALEFDLSTGAGQVVVKELYPQPLRLEAAHLRGSVEDSLKIVRVDRAELQLENLDLFATLSADREDDLWRASVTVQIEELSIAALNQYFPPGVADGARNWITENIPSGAIHDADVRIGLSLVTAPGTEVLFEGLEGSFRFDDLTVAALAPKSPIEGLEGTARMTEQRFDFVVEKGHLENLEVRSGTVTIGDFGTDTPQVTVAVAVAGPLETAVDLVTGEPLELLSPDLLKGLSGRSDTDLRLEIPLYEAAVSFSASSRLQDLAWTAAPLDLDIRGNKLSLSVDERALSVEGEGSINGVTVDVTYRESFEEGAEPRRRASLETVIDEKSLEALKLPEQTYLTGPAKVRIDYAADEDGSQELRAHIGLLKSKLELPQLGWKKPPGQAGELRLVARSDGQTWQVESLVLSAEDFLASINGRLEIDPLQVTRAELERLEYGRNLVRGSFSRSEDDKITVRLAGPRFDAGPLIAYLKKPTEGNQPRLERPKVSTPIEVRVMLMEVLGLKEVRFRGLVAGGVYDGSRIREAGLTAQIGNHDAILLRHGPQGKGEGERLSLSVENFGELLKAFDATTEISGGMLELQASQPTPEEPISGVLTIKDFQLLQQPHLLRILSMASLNGLLESFVDGEGFDISLLETHLSWQSPALTFSRGRLYGSGLGATVEGTYDLDEGSIDASGALAPMATIQRLIEHIPVVSQVLMGIHKEGIVATHFTVNGVLSEPEIKVAPLSTFTIGITRDIFRIFPDSKEAREHAKKEAKAATSVEPAAEEDSRPPVRQ